MSSMQKNKPALFRSYIDEISPTGQHAVFPANDEWITTFLAGKKVYFMGKFRTEKEARALHKKACDRLARKGQVLLPRMKNSSEMLDFNYCGNDPSKPRRFSLQPGVTYDNYVSDTEAPKAAASKPASKKRKEHPEPAQKEPKKKKEPSKPKTSSERPTVPKKGESLKLGEAKGSLHAGEDGLKDFEDGGVSEHKGDESETDEEPMLGTHSVESMEEEEAPICSIARWRGKLYFCSREGCTTAMHLGCLDQSLNRGGQIFCPVCEDPIESKGGDNIQGKQDLQLHNIQNTSEPVPILKVVLPKNRLDVGDIARLNQILSGQANDLPEKVQALLLKHYLCVPQQSSGTVTSTA